MYDRNAIVELVETAENAHRLCSCGAPMVPADEAGALWLLSRIARRLEVCGRS